MIHSIRPLATMGVALTSAGVIAAGPVPVSGPPTLATHTVASVQLLASPDEIWAAMGDTNIVPLLQLSVLPMLIGGNFDFTTFDGVQHYVDVAGDWLQTNSAPLVGWGDTLDSWITPIGISGVGDWVGGEHDLYSAMLADDWDSVAWYQAASADPGIFYTPIAEFDLGWLYSLLGAPEEAYAPLNELLGLESSLLTGYLNEFLMVTILPVGFAAQVLAGNVDLTDADTMALLESGSWEEFVQPAVTSINDQIQDILGDLQGMDGMDGLLSMLSFLG